MGYGYYSRSYSYNSADPEEISDSGIEQLIDKLKQSIDDQKLKDMKSALSKLKLGINDKYPMFTKTAASFGAYLYAINNKKKKAADSLLKAILKKNYTYDGFPLYTLVDNLSKADMSIIINDVLNVNRLWNLEGDMVEEMFEKYPKETEKFIIDGRLNKFEKGEARVETTITAINFSSSTKTAIAALNTFFGKEYVEKYGIHSNKLKALLKAVDEKDDNFKKEIRSEFFYNVAAESIHHDILVDDYEKGFLNDLAIKNYTEIMFKNHKGRLIQSLQYMTENIELRVKIIGSNDALMDHVTKNYPNLLPQEMKDIFLF